MNELALLDQHIVTANRAIARIATIAEAKDCVNQANVLKIILRKQRATRRMRNRAAEIEVRATRRMGELLIAMKKHVGSRNRGKDNSGGSLMEPPKYDDLGITKKQAHVAQKIAKIPENDFEDFILYSFDTERLTLSHLVELTEQLEAQRRNDELRCREVQAANGTYDTIVVDPPWPMKMKMPYSTMSQEDIAAIRLPAAEHCHLFLWTTQGFLPVASDILKAWGFNYCSTFVWHKDGGQYPTGYPQYNCEFVLYARKGSPTFTTTKGFKTCFYAKRGKHSEKPEYFYEEVRRVTAGRRLDMFGRRRIEGFDSWGNEAPSPITTPKKQTDCPVDTNTSHPVSTGHSTDRPRLTLYGSGMTVKPC